MSLSPKRPERPGRSDGPDGRQTWPRGTVRRRRLARDAPNSTETPAPRKMSRSARATFANEPAPRGPPGRPLPTRFKRGGGVAINNLIHPPRAKITQILYCAIKVVVRCNCAFFTRTPEIGGASRLRERRVLTRAKALRAHAPVPRFCKLLSKQNLYL